MADLIRLDGIRAFGHHGVFEQETRDGQWFVIDVELRLDLTEAGQSDDLAATVHYGELAQDIHDAVVGEPCQLIEALAERIAQVCLSRERVQSARVTVHKPSAPIEVEFGDVSVVIERSKR